MILLKILFTIILFLWLLRLVATVVFPYLMALLVGKMQRETQKQYQHHSYEQGSPRPDGRIHIDYVPPKTGKKKPSIGNMGEFVDFEEVK